MTKELIEELRAYATALRASVHVPHTGADLIERGADALVARQPSEDDREALANQLRDIGAVRKVDQDCSCQDCEGTAEWVNAPLSVVLEHLKTNAPATGPTHLVCAWCPQPARGDAWHNDGKLHPSCGQIDHGQGWVPPYTPRAAVPDAAPTLCVECNEVEVLGKPEHRVLCMDCAYETGRAAVPDAVTDAREHLHAKCDCVPDLGPAHCHLCSADGSPVEWANCVAVQQVTDAPETVEVAFKTVEVERLGHLLVQLSPATPRNGAATVRRLMEEMNIKEVVS